MFEWKLIQTPPREDAFLHWPNRIFVEEGILDFLEHGDTVSKFVFAQISEFLIHNVIVDFPIGLVNIEAARLINL